MRFRKLGRAGLRVSEIALGTYLTVGVDSDYSRAEAVVRQALELGVTLFDTADVYAGGEAERVLGRALSGVPRSSVVLATKCFFPTGEGPNDRGLSRKHVVESVHGSLRRLNTDVIDLMQCHRFDPETPVEETLGALDDLLRSGKILSWGVSRWPVEHLDALLACCDETHRARLVSVQEPYHLLFRGFEQSLDPWCARHGVGALLYAPLAQGVLTGKYRGPGDDVAGTRAGTGAREQMYQYTPAHLATVERLTRVAREAGVTLSQLAIAWVLRLPSSSTALLGASRPEQLRENVRACEVTLDAGLLAAIEVALTGPDNHT